MPYRRCRRGSSAANANVRRSIRCSRGERIVTIVGPGGIGKTRLALEVARARTPRHRDGVAFVDLSTARTPDAALAALASATRVELRGGDALPQITRALTRVDALLVIDNCEHLVADASRAIGAIVAGCAGITILATSREDLRITGGAALRLGPLGEACASELFAERARSHDATFELGDDNVADVAEICRRLDGIALAIELAATRMRSIGARELRALVTRRFAALRVGPSDRPTRQQTLAALVDWSYSLLDERERVFFECLSVFGGTYTLEAAAAVATADTNDEFVALDLLDSLVAKSLVVRQPGDGTETRYVLLETMREFAEARLAQRAYCDAVRLRFVEFVRAHVARHAAAFEDDPRESLVRPIARDEANVFAALDAALALDAYVSGATILTLAITMSFAERETERTRYAARFVRVLDEAELALHARLAAIVAFTRAYESSCDGSAMFEQGLALAHRSGDAAAIVFVAYMQAISAFLAGRLDEARAAIAVIERLPLPSTRTLQRMRILEALRATYEGDRELAIRLFSNCVTAETFLGNDRNVAVALNNIAEAEHARGNTAAALAAVDRLPATRLRRGSNAIIVQSNIAGYLAAVDRVAEAREAAVAAFAMGGAPGMYGNVFVHLALVRALEGHFAAAATLLGFIEANYPPPAQGHVTERISLGRLSAILAEQLTPRHESDLRSLGASLDFDRACAVACEPPAIGLAEV